MAVNLQAICMFLPAKVSNQRIASLIAQGAIANNKSGGQSGDQDMHVVTFTCNGRIVDQIEFGASPPTPFMSLFNLAVSEGTC